MSSAQERLKIISKHLNLPTDESSIEEFVSSNQISSLPLKRQNLLKWNGWGYNDSQLEYDTKTETVFFTGRRYLLSGKHLPSFHKWAQEMFKVNFNCSKKNLKQNDILSKLPEPRINERFIQDVTLTNIRFSFDKDDRLFHSHGHNLHEIYNLKFVGEFKRIPDIVIWPKCHQDVVKLIQLATVHNVVIIPFGGGTNVTGALECPERETRMIVSLDTSQMNKILWIDHRNLTAKAESGIIGQDLDRFLSIYNFCTGHEPDSLEFSSLGGWISTRASGMKKNIYGNIEDLVVHVRMVTPQGTMERNCSVPRISSGPDVQQLILGSEGTLGVITEAIIKLRPIPQCKKYGSFVFPQFEQGYHFVREVALKRFKPASIRLMDNEQFIFGQALKPAADSLWATSVDTLKRIYITKIKGFDIHQMCVATIALEGSNEEVQILESHLLTIAAKYNGAFAGEENGLRGYMLTFFIGYIRDAALDFGVLAESFETSVSWDNCLKLCSNVKECIRRQLKRYNINEALISCRLTQTYDTGVCIYFYFAFNYLNVTEDNPVKIYNSIEEAARNEILASGGSISHHHGVGKIRKQWLKDTVSDVGLGLMKAIKNYIDPNNIFGNGNLIN